MYGVIVVVSGKSYNSQLTPRLIKNKIKRQLKRQTKRRIKHQKMPKLDLVILPLSVATVDQEDDGIDGRKVISPNLKTKI